MTFEFVIEFLIDALKTGLLLVAPMLLFGLIAGLLMSIFQAVTSIQEMSLIFIPKILAVVTALIIFLPWMVRFMIDFTQNLILNIPNFVH